MNNIKFQFFGRTDLRRNHEGVIAVMTDVVHNNESPPSNYALHLAYSYCHPSIDYDKKIAKEIAVTEMETTHTVIYLSEISHSIIRHHIFENALKIRERRGRTFYPANWMRRLLKNA